MNDGNEPERAEQYSGAVAFARLAAEFEQLRQLPAPAREAALARLSAAEPTLTTELRRLLACHSEDAEEMATPARVFAPTDLAAGLEALDDRPPERIGPYRPLRQLGRGGMGIVYLAERDDADFKRLVAIKLLRGGSDRDLHRRFRTERRILAQLEHANIAALYDGGTTADGQPYVVMEYVAGSDILTHCRTLRLELGARIRLFIKVCRAVAHAHRALVVHRDLKPSNILVDADGQPKLLDFGIAKLLDATPDEHEVALTRTGHMLLTPEYSSPEQVRGQQITTATDVYSLGAILYELLSGRRAQPLANRSLATMLEVVCDRSPPAMSTEVTSGITQRSLRGDLDTIVACAMRKEPERRYAGASALADDLERFLDGLPVTAQRDTLGYRLEKFVRRNRLPVAAMAALLLSLVGFAATTAVQNRTIARERDVAVTQRHIAGQISEFLVGLFEMASPDPERAESLRARELLDRGARSIDEDLTAAPAQRAAMQLAMGRAYYEIGLYRDAAPLLTAAELAMKQLAPDSEAHRDAQFVLGECRVALDDHAAGEALVLASLADTAAGPQAVSTRVSRLAALAAFLRDHARYDEAERRLDEAEQLAGGPIVDAHVQGRDLRIGRAVIVRERGQLDRSLELLRAAEADARKRGEIDKPICAILFRELGITHKELGELEEARDALEHALVLTRKYAGDSHPDVDSIVFEQAMLETDFGDYARAEGLLREVLRRDIDRFGLRDAFVALDKTQLGMVIGHLDRPDEAEALMKEGLQLQRELLPAGHPELPTTLSNLATFYQQRRRYAEARPLAEEAYRLRLQLYGPDDARVLTARNTLAVIQLDSGDAAGAEPLFRALVEARQKLLGEHVATAGSLLALGDAIARQNRHAEAIPWLEESLRIFDATLPEDHPVRALPRVVLGMSHLALAEPAAAEPFLRDAAAIRHKTLGPSHSATCSADLHLARALAAGGKNGEAEQLLRDLEQRIDAARPGDRVLDDVRALLAELASGK